MLKLHPGFRTRCEADRRGMIGDIKGGLWGVVDGGPKGVPACVLCWPSGAYISVKPSPRSLSMGDSLPGS